MMQIGILCEVYNYTPLECLKLKCRQFQLFFQEAIKLQARTSLGKIEISSFPKLEESARTDILRRLRTTAEMGTKSENKIIDEDWNLLRNMGRF